MRSIKLWMTAAAFVAVTAGPLARQGGAQQHGGGPDPQGDVFVEGVNLGTYWYGAPIDKRALIGKVVLLEIWGS